MNGGFAALVAGMSRADLSTLMALRALVDRCNGDGVVERANWLTGVREEYHRRYTGHGQPQNFAEAETLRYLDEHIVHSLADAGVLEQPPRAADGDGADPAWAAVRLSPWAAAEVEGGRGDILNLLDTRIEAILNETDGAGAVLAPDASLDAPVTAADRTPTLVPGGATLSARGLVKTYRKRRVVNEVDLHVSQGEIVGLLGPNGAGKTTSFYMMVGLIRPDRGNVFIGDRDLTGVPMYRRARAGIGYLAQEPSIFRKLTVEENVMAILQMMKFPKAERKRRLETLLDELSIKHVRKSRAYALSGGERRRLEITRALVGEPKFMLLDEPFAGVDPIAVHDIQQIVSGLRKRGIGVLISDHNVEQTLDIVDRAYIMYDGKVRVSGTVSELVWNDEVAEIYLGPTLTARMRERYARPPAVVDEYAGDQYAGDGYAADEYAGDEYAGGYDSGMDEYAGDGYAGGYHAAPEGAWAGDDGGLPPEDPFDDVLDGPGLAWANPAHGAPEGPAGEGGGPAFDNGVNGEPLARAENRAEPVDGRIVPPAGADEPTVEYETVDGARLGDHPDALDRGPAPRDGDGAGVDDGRPPGAMDGVDDGRAPGAVMDGAPANDGVLDDERPALRAQADGADAHAAPGSRDWPGTFQGGTRNPNQDEAV